RLCHPASPAPVAQRRRGSGYRVSESLPELIPFNQQVHQVLSDARPLPRTPILACGRPPPLRSGRSVLTKSNSSQTIKKPASLRSDGVQLRPGTVFSFPPECCSAWPESPPKRRAE